MSRKKDNAGRYNGRVAVTSTLLGGLKMLIAMAGLPATGKSALAARLAQELAAVILNKDQVRAVLFPPPVLDYSAGQDAICMAAIYHAAARTLQTFPQQAVIIDGRTFLRAHQIADLCALAAPLNEVPRIIECMCDDEVARARLDTDLARGEHPARNRTFALYLALKAAAEPIAVPRLVLDTGKLSLEDCVECSLAYLRAG